METVDHNVFQKRIRYKHCMAVSYVALHLCNPNRNHWAEETGAVWTSIALPGAGRRIWVAPCMVVFSAARMLSSTTIMTCSVSTMLFALQMSRSRTNGRKECWRLWTFSTQTVLENHSTTSSNCGTFQCWSTLMNQWSRSFSKSLGAEFFLKVPSSRIHLFHQQSWIVFYFCCPSKGTFLSHWRQAAFLRKAQRWCLTVVFIARIPLTRTVRILNLRMTFRSNTSSRRFVCSLPLFSKDVFFHGACVLARTWVVLWRTRWWSCGWSGRNCQQTCRKVLVDDEMGLEVLYQPIGTVQLLVDVFNLFEKLWQLVDFNWFN